MRHRGWLLSMLGAAALAACSGGAPPTPTPSPRAATATTQPTPLPTVTPTPVIDLASVGAAKLTVTPNPDFAVVAERILFVSGAGDPEGVQLIDSGGNVVADFAVPDVCAALDVGFGAVWVPSCSMPALYRIDIGTRTMETIDVGGMLAAPESSIGAAEGGVWLLVGSGPSSLVRIDPASLTITASYVMPGRPTTVRAGLGAIWVSDPLAGIVHRVDPATGAIVADVQVGRLPQFMTVGEGAVWTMDQQSGTVSRIDPATNTVAATIRLGELVDGGDIATGAGSVWLRGSRTLLFRIDPASNEIVARYGPNCGSGSVAVDGAAAWITAHDCQTVWRLPLE